MKGIDNIIARMKEDNRRECQEILGQAQSRAEEVRRHYAGEMERLRADETARQQEQLALEEKSCTDQMRLHQRAAILQEKQEQVEKAFQNALEALETLDPARREKLYLLLASRAVQPGQRGEVLLQEEDRKTVGSTLLTAYPQLHLSADAPGAAGLILRYGAVEVDCTLPTLLEELRSVRSAEIADVLFGDHDEG